jgi:tetratricopeptide (TPR) repeat protein
MHLLPKWIRHLVMAWTLVLAGDACFAQCKDIVWPKDSALAEQARVEIARLQGARKSRDYRAATGAITWLARNAPQADTNLYIDAERIYSELLTRERSRTVKKLYLDSIYRFYDLRARHCDKFLDVDDARAMALYRYFVSDQPEVVRKQLGSLVRRKGEESSEHVLVAYMESVKAEYRKYGKLSNDEILQCYNTAIHVAELKRSHVRKAKLPEEPVMRLMDDIDAILFSLIVVDCQFVIKTLGPRFREYPDDLMLARRIISLMLQSQSQCINSPLWLQAAERIYISQDKPDYTLAKSIGLRFYNAKNYTQAKYYLNEAVALAPTGTDKSEMLILVGQIEARANKSKARALFRSALEADKNNKEAFERIGDLYFDSEKSCSGNEKITPLLVYMLAADYYQRAGNGKKISMAREKFPPKATLKQWGYTEGQEISVECWIQETTTIRAKN